uniref:ANK_REP_REGION domain-containing protein n=1 Tax=Parastrongyloides trichosuri TaxID=131310 RepID=A0A0N4ZQD3_PARTI
MVINVKAIFEEGLLPESILHQLDECGKTEVDFFKVILDIYFCIGGRRETISIADLNRKDKNVWNAKWVSGRVRDSDLLPKGKDNDMECDVAFNTLKALGFFMESQNKKIFDKYKSIFKEHHTDGNLPPKTSIHLSQQPLMSAAHEIIDSNKWTFGPRAGEKKVAFYGNVMNLYRLELCSMMGYDEKFKQMIETLNVFAQRFCEYVETTTLGRVVFDWLLEQASNNDKTGAAELLLSIMLTSNFEKEYVRHQCNDTNHNYMDIKSLPPKRYTLNVSGLRRIYFTMVVDKGLTKDNEKEICGWETLQELDFMHQMLFFEDEDATELSIPFLLVWLYSGFPLAVIMCVKMLEFLVKDNKKELLKYKTSNDIIKLRHFLFILISHNKDNSAVCMDVERMPEKMPLLTEDEITLCSEVYASMVMFFQQNISIEEIKLLTGTIKSTDSLRPIVNIVFNRHKKELIKTIDLIDFMNYTEIYCCSDNHILFNNLMIDLAGKNAIVMLKAFFNNNFKNCLQKKPNERTAAFILMSIGLLKETIQILMELSMSRKDNVFIQTMKEFNMLEIFKNIFDNTDKYYSILNPGLKLLIYVLKLNTAWFTTMDNVNIFKDYAQTIFIKTQDSITISLLSELFEFFYLWTRNFHGNTSSQFNEMTIYLNATLFKDCNDILKTKFYTLLSNYKGLDLSFEYAIMKLGILSPTEYIHQAYSHIFTLIKDFGSPHALRALSELGVQMWKHILCNFKMKKNVINWEFFKKIFEYFNELINKPGLKLARPVAEFLKCVFQISAIEKDSLKRSNLIDKMVNEKFLDKLGFILVKEIFGETPFYFCSGASNLQAVYLNMPESEAIGQIEGEIVSSFELLSSKDKQEIKKESIRRLHTYKMRSEELLLENIESMDEESIRFHFNHVNIRLAKICAINDPLEDWESKGNLLSALKFIFIASKNDGIRKKIKDAVEWLYAFTLLCPYGKYEDLFIHVKYCIVLKPNDEGEKQAFIDRIGLMIFSILDNAHTLSNGLKYEFAKNAIQKLASKF